MSTHRIDYKEMIEEITGLKVYPVVIPQGAATPCIEMQIFGGGRSGDANLMDPNIRDYRISIKVCSDKISTNAPYETMLVDALDGKSMTYGDTKTLGFNYIGTTETYNYAQDLHEMDVEFTAKKN